MPMSACFIRAEYWSKEGNSASCLGALLDYKLSGVHWYQVKSVNSASSVKALFLHWLSWRSLWWRGWGRRGSSSLKERAPRRTQSRPWLSGEPWCVLTEASSREAAKPTSLSPGSDVIRIQVFQGMVWVSCSFSSLSPLVSQLLDFDCLSSSPVQFNLPLSSMSRGC